jgi:putative ABC transport system permease protein
MKQNNLSLPIKLARLELRQGWKHFSVFVACLVLGVAIMASVNTFGALVKKSLSSEAQSLLGGDMEIRIRGIEATKEQQQFLEKYGKISYVATMRSMLHFNDKHTVVEIKAVDKNYPLLGKLAFNEEITKEEVFASNGIAVDSILLSQMNLKIGDEVRIGEANYIIRATLKTEPDRAVQIFSFGAKVLMSDASLALSKLVSTFSLTEHRYRVLTAKNIKVNEEYEKQVEDELSKHFPDTSWRVSIGTDGNQTLKRFLDQLLAFMSLSGLATFLIAGIGIGSSVRAYLEKKSQTIAVLKVQGASRKVVLSTYSLVIAALALAGGVLGALIAIIITTSLVPLLATILPTLKGQSGIHFPSSLLAIWYGFLIAYLFSIPALLSAVNIRPSVLFRSKMAMLNLINDKNVRIAIAVTGLLLLATLFASSDDYIFTAGAIAIILMAFGLFYLCALCVKKMARKVQVKKPWLKLALGNMYRTGSTTGTVIFAIGISLSVLIALTLTEANFQARIKQLMDEKAPSLFMIDIQPHQTEGIKNLLLQYAAPDKVMIFPMVRGRMTHLNKTPIEQVKVNDDISWAVNGDRGLSYSELPPANANIVKGTWWEKDYKGKPLISVDSRFLSGMGIDIGDTITLSILGQDVTAEIANAREIDYSTFQMNFAIIFSPNTLEGFPHTSLATIYLDKNNNQEFELIEKIVKDFAGVTVVRTKEVVDLVQNIMQHIATALGVTVAISIFAGLLVLTSALSATIQQRMYDIAILKVLGAKRSDILKSCTAEWMLLALSTSVIAASIGTFSAFMINTRLRGQEFYFMPHITITTIIVCMVVIWIIGYMGNRRLFSFRCSTLLRNE